MDVIHRVDKMQSEIDRLTRELAERDKQIIELERLCDDKYCATGADAYYHCCELTEQWDDDRLKKGLAPIYGPGEGRSLCGWIDSIRQLLEDAEARAIPDGWVAVPVEPTAEMIDRVLREGAYHDEPKARAVLRAEYMDMLSARPELPKESDQQKPEVSYE